MMTSARTLRIDLSYKGTEFRGFAENPGVRTVGGELRQALETVLGEEIELTIFAVRGKHGDMLIRNVGPEL